MEKNPELITVIIAAYNAERKIRRCLDSILKQSYKNIEIIVVNNGSTDNTEKIVGEYIKENNNMILMQQPKQGPGPAKNVAAKEANGDILVFVDSDEYPHKDYIEKLTKPIREGKAGTSIGSWIIADPKNPWARCRYHDAHCFRQHAVHSGVFRAIGKKDFLKTGGFDPSKGISDDRLATGLERTRVDKAIFDHDVDNTLSEIYNKRKWIGKTAIGNKKGRRFKIKIVLVFLLLMLAIIGIIAYSPLLIGIGIILLLFVIYATLRKVLFYKDLRLLFYYPLYLAVYIIAMISGLSSYIFRRLLR
ncbi:MAG: glycosyltransferase family 2 protein [Nanoarchaeota archaeon]|nr:glycosyltransferase family 2 protein [Nanoarchaeota archaeon]